MLKQRLQKASQPIKTSHFGQQQTFCGQISSLKLNNRNSLPPRSKMIRRQKIATYNTVEDEPNDKIDDVYIYTTHTPKNPKTQKQYPHQKLKSKDQIRSFNIDDSFSNKHITVKKQYQPRFNDQSQEIELNKDKIALKNYFQCHKRGISEVYKSKGQPSAQDKQENNSGNGLIVLKDGWSYKGQYVSGLFHGFGELYHKDKLIYSGNFEFGYFSGYGKLQSHPSFNYLLQVKTISPISSEGRQLGDESLTQLTWSAYFGQFHKGNISGYGELWLSNGEKLASKWRKGAQIGKYWVLSSANSQVD